MRVEKVAFVVLLFYCFNYVYPNSVPKQQKKNTLEEETFKSKRAIQQGPQDSLKYTVNSLLRGMELSQLKRSVDSQLSSIDISMFTKPAERDDDDVDKKIPEWLASVNARIPNGAQVKKDSITTRTLDSDKALENLLQAEAEKEIAKKKAQFKKSVEANEQIDVESKRFLEKLFSEAEAQEKKSNIPKEVSKTIPKEVSKTILKEVSKTIPKEVSKNIPKLKIAKKGAEESKHIDAESKALLEKLFAESKRDVAKTEKLSEKEIPKSKEAKKTVEAISQLDIKSKNFLEKLLAENQNKKEIPKKEVHQIPTKKHLPEFLKEAIAENKEVNRRLAKEMATNKVYATFGATEKKTVERFMDALKKISEEETKLKVKKELKQIKSKKSTKNALYVIDENEKCVDQEEDCREYQEYCHVYKTTMKQHCRKTCGFCTTGCGADKEDSLCKVIKQLGYCGRPTAQMKCPETCQCEQCKNSIYGCCWDKKTIKDDYIGSNCPVCENKYEHSTCMMFIEDCHSNNMVTKKWMYTNCMETCGLCRGNNIQPVHPNAVGSSHIKTCSDDEEQSEFCPIWRNAGWCEEKMELMQSYCEKTCYNCLSQYNNNTR
eukprot:TCONS_00068150-protein